MTQPAGFVFSMVVLAVLNAMSALGSWLNRNEPSSTLLGNRRFRAAWSATACAVCIWSAFVWWFVP